MNDKQRKGLLETVALLNDMVRSTGQHTPETEGAVLAAFAVLRRKDQFTDVLAEFVKTEGTSGYGVRAEVEQLIRSEGMTREHFIDAMSDLEITMEITRQVLDIDRQEVLDAAVKIMQGG